MSKSKIPKLLLILCTASACSVQKFAGKEAGVDVNQHAPSDGLLDVKLELPVKVTAGNDTSFLPDLSPNARFVVYTAEVSGNKDLFEKKAEGGFGRRLTTHPADDFGGVVSPDGSKIAFISRRHDASGDIHILDLGWKWFGGGAANEPAQRNVALLKSEEQSPAWFPDSKKLIFSSRKSGDAESSLMVASIADLQATVLEDLRGDQPDISPDGKFIVYVRGGRIFVKELGGGPAKQIDMGQGVLAGQPRFSSDGTKIVFVRYADDTNRDGNPDLNDNGAIWMIPSELALSSACDELCLAPLTLSDRRVHSPRMTKRYLYTVRQVEESLDVYRTPATGQIDVRKLQQKELIELSLRHPDLDTQIYVLQAGVANFIHIKQLEAAGEIAVRLIRSLAAARRTAEAKRVHGVVLRRFNQDAKVVNSADLALLESEDNDRVLADGLKQLSSAVSMPIDFQARLKLQKARLAVLRKELVQAHGLLAEINSDFLEVSEVCAEADLLRAKITIELAGREAAYRAFSSVVSRQAQNSKVRSAAIRELLELVKAEGVQEGEKLNQLKGAFKDIPELPAAIHLRIANRFVAANQRSVAINELRTIIAQYAGSPSSVFAAAQQLTELYEEKRQFAEADSALTTLMAQLDGAPESLRTEARQFVGRFLVRRGEALMRDKEPGMAFKEFQRAIEMDRENLAAHRGVIDSLAARRELQNHFTDLRKRKRESPGDVRIAYLCAYAATYEIDAANGLGAKISAVDRAIELAEEARELDSRLLHVHQTLGWLYQQKAFWLAKYREQKMVGWVSSKAAEVRSMFGSAEPRWGEMAADSYLNALYIAEKNSIEEANISQNLGHTYFELGNFQKALRFYLRRISLAKSVMFRDADTEALVYRRAGRAAFAAEQLKLAIKLQQESLSRYEKLNFVEGIAYSLDALALSFREDGRPAEAVPLYERLLAHHRSTQNRWNELGTLVNLAFATFAANELEKSETILDEANVVSEKYSNELASSGDGDDSSVKIDLGGEDSAAKGFNLDWRRSMIAALRVQIAEKRGNPLDALERAMKRFVTISGHENKVVSKEILAADQSRFDAVVILLNNIGSLEDKLGRHIAASESFAAAAEALFSRGQQRRQEVSTPELQNRANYFASRIKAASAGLLGRVEIDADIGKLSLLIDRLSSLAQKDSPIAKDYIGEFYLKRATLTRLVGISGTSDLIASLEANRSGLRKREEKIAASIALVDESNVLPTVASPHAAHVMDARETLFSNNFAGQRWKYYVSRGLIKEALIELKRHLTDSEEILAEPTGPELRLLVSAVSGRINQLLSESKESEAVEMAELYEEVFVCNNSTNVLGRRTKPDDLVNCSLAAWIPEQTEAHISMWLLNDSRVWFKIKRQGMNSGFLVNDTNAASDADVTKTAKILRENAAKVSEQLRDSSTVYYAVYGAKSTLEHVRLLGEFLERELSLQTLAFIPSARLVGVVKSLARLPKVSLGLLRHEQDTAAATTQGQTYSVNAQSFAENFKKAAVANDVVQLGGGEKCCLLRPASSISSHSYVMISNESISFRELARFASGHKTTLARTLIVELGGWRSQGTANSPGTSDPTNSTVAAELVVTGLLSGFSSVVWFNEGQLSKLSPDMLALIGGFDSKSVASRLLHAGGVLAGHGGFSANIARKFAEDNLDRTVEAAEDAMDDQNFDEAIRSFRDALYLAKILNESAVIDNLLQNLMQCYYLVLDYNAALRFQEELIERGSHADVKTGKAQLNAAVLAVRANELKKSNDWLEHAEKLTKETDFPAVAKIWHYRGIIAEAERDYDSTIKHYNNSRLLSQKGGDALAAAQRLIDIGSVYKERLSNFPQALVSFDAAREELEKQNNRNLLLNLQIDRANTLLALGDVKWAIGVLEKHVVAQIDAKKDPTGWIRASQILANSYFRVGYYQDAIDQNRKIQAVFAAIDNARSLAQAKIDWLNLEGMLAAKLSSFEKAMERFAEAESLAKQFGLRDKLATIYNNAGFWARENEHVATSIDFFNKALAIDGELKLKTEVAFDQRNLGLSLILTGNMVEAEKMLVSARDSSLALGLQYNFVYSEFGLGEIAVRAQKWDIAEKHYQTALMTAEKSFLLDFVWRAKAALAKTKVARSDFASAKDLLYSSLEIIEKMRAGLKSESSRTGFQSDRGVQGVYEDLVSVLMHLQKYEDAWIVAERARARAFLDAIGNQRLSFANKDAGAFIETDRKLASEIEILERKIALGESDLEENKRLLADVRARRSVLHMQIRKQDPQLLQYLTVSTISREEFSALIPAGTKVLEYMVVKDRVHIWVIDRAKISGASYMVQSSQLQTKVEDFRSLLQSYSATDFLGKELANILITPIAGMIDDSNALIIIPHGPLHYLSFATLPVDGKHLVDRFVISYMESATFASLLASQPRMEDRNPKSILALGNPRKTESLELPFAERETSAIVRYFPAAQIFNGEKATKQNLLTKLSQADVIHLATHGVFDADSPAASKILLAGVNEGADLAMSEVLATRLKAQLVVLSACESGLGRVAAGDEVAGMTRAFFYAGAEGIIASLWRISDVASAVIMKRFYRGLAAGRSPAEALRDAQLLIRQYYPHPAYWSAFRLTFWPVGSAENMKTSAALRSH